MVRLFAAAWLELWRITKADGAQAGIAVFRRKMDGLHAGIEGLHARMETSRGKMDGLRGKMDGLHGKMDGLHGKMDGLHSRIEGFRVRIDTLPAGIRGFTRKTQSFTVKMLNLKPGINFGLSDAGSALLQKYFSSSAKRTE